MGVGDSPHGGASWQRGRAANPAATQRSGHGHCLDVGLAQAAQWLALPRHWGMTTPGGDVGGAHAGYRMYPCADGWVALAALEPHFAQRIAQVAGLVQRDGSYPACTTAAPTPHWSAFSRCNAANSWQRWQHKATSPYM